MTMKRMADSFIAKFTGKCQSCGDLYVRGNSIVGAGKGNGAMHTKCAASHGLTTRRATQEDLDALRAAKALRSVARSVGSAV